MSVEVDIMSPTSDQNAKSLSSRWESKMKTHQLKDNVWRYEAGKTTKEKIYYLLWVKELHWLLNLAKLYGAMKRFHPSTPKISLVHVILLTVFGTILMMLGEITVESTKNPPNWQSTWFSLLACLISHWHWKEKFCLNLNHSLELKS